MENKYTENNYIELWTEGNILFMNYKPNANIQHMAVNEILNLISMICKEESYLVLNDMNNLKWIDKQARDLLASHPITNQMSAWAFFSRDPIHKIMYNIFLTFSKPEVKTEFFTNKEKGLNWLKEYRRD